MDSSNTICKIDNSSHASIEDMHKYLRRFKIKQCDYYKQYYPRFDLLTKDIIEYKNYDQYFSQDFANKNNLKKWLKQNPIEGLEWSKKWLAQRQEKKDTFYAPTEVELKSLSCPPMSYYELHGGYYKITEELGFLRRFSDNSLIFKTLPNDSVIVTDTREQKGLKIKHKTSKECINVGDYALKGEYDLGIRIERKSLPDFVGTLSSGYERFVRELQRCVDKNLYVVMLVESSLSDALGFDYLPQMRWAKAKPQHIFKQLRDLLHQFPLHFQAIFVDGRDEAAKKLIRIFELGQQVKLVDLQYKLQKGEL